MSASTATGLLPSPMSLADPTGPSTAPDAYHFIPSSPSMPFPGWMSPIADNDGNGTGNSNSNSSDSNDTRAAAVQPPIFAASILANILWHSDHASLLALRASSTHLRSAAEPFLETHMIIRETKGVGLDGVVHVHHAPAIPVLDFLQEMYQYRIVRGMSMKTPTITVRERMLFSQTAGRAETLEIATSAPMAAGLVAVHNAFWSLQTLHLRADKHSRIPFGLLPYNVLRPHTLVISVDERGYSGLAAESFVGGYDPVVFNIVRHLVLDITAGNPFPQESMEAAPEHAAYEPTEVDGSDSGDSNYQGDDIDMGEIPEETPESPEDLEMRALMEARLAEYVAALVAESALDADSEAAPAPPLKPEPEPTLHAMSPNRGVDFRAPVLINLESIRVNVGPGVSHLQVARLVVPYLVRDHSPRIKVTFAGIGQPTTASRSRFYLDSTTRAKFLDTLRILAWAARHAVEPRHCPKRLRVELGLVELVPELPEHLYAK